MGYKYKKQKFNPVSYLMGDHNVQSTLPPGTWAAGSQPSSASLDGTHSPLDATIVEAEPQPEEEETYNAGRNPMQSGAGYSLDPGALHRQLANLSYQDVNAMTGMYSPTGQFSAEPVGQGWAASASVPSLTGGAGYTHDPATGPELATVMSRSLSDQNIPQSQSRRESISVATELLGTLSMSGRDNAALLAPTGRQSRRGSLIPPPAPLRQAALQEMELFGPSNTTLTNSTTLDRAELRSQSGWSFVPQGYTPVLFPAHLAANGEILQIIQKYGGMFPTVSPLRATMAGQGSDEKSVSQSKDSPTVPAETEVYNLQKPRKPPRPANSFILYRRAKQDEVMKSNDGMTNNEVSRLIGHMWAQESAEVKELYKSKAEDAKRLHNLTFPDYKYAPRKPAKSKKPAETGGGKKRSISEGSPDYRFPDSSRQSQTSGHTSRAEMNTDLQSPSPRSPHHRAAAETGQHQHKWQAGLANPNEAQMYPSYPPYFSQSPHAKPTGYPYPAYQHLPYQQPQPYAEMDLSNNPAYRGGRAFQYPMQGGPHPYAYSGYAPAPPHPLHDAGGMAVRSQSAPPARPHPGTYQQPPPGAYGMPPPLPQQHYQQPQPPVRQYAYPFHPASGPGQWPEHSGQ